jgi:hypothetical protein
MSCYSRSKRALAVKIILYIGFHSIDKDNDKPMLQEEKIIQMEMEPIKVSKLIRALKELTIYLVEGEK